MPRLLIVGGSDAGITAALRAREVAPQLDVTVVVADAFPNYSICGLPFYLSGEVADWHDLAHRTAAEIAAHGIELVLDTRATAIDARAQHVTVMDTHNTLQTLPYDRLIIATGARPQRPPITGIDLPGVFPLHTMDDSFRLQQFIEKRQPRTAVIIGAGYIGVEMADALTHRGIEVTLVQRGPSVLPTVEPEMGTLIAEELQGHGVKVITGVGIERIEQAVDGLLRVSASSDFQATTDLVLVAVGVEPQTELAQTARVVTGEPEARGAISVTRSMATSVPGIYAAGDCVETHHRLLGHPMYLPLGTTAHKQGRVAGENAALDLLGVSADRKRQFAGTLGTQVVKVFDIAVARTGLLAAEARAADYEPLTSASVLWDHKHYYPGAQELHIRITGDRRTSQLLGAQIVGDWHSEVAKRIDIFAAALFHGMSMEALNDLDLSYTPPVSSPWDPVQMAAQQWLHDL